MAMETSESGLPASACMVLQQVRMSPSLTYPTPCLPHHARQLCDMVIGEVCSAAVPSAARPEGTSGPGAAQLLEGQQASRERVSYDHLAPRQVGLRAVLEQLPSLCGDDGPLDGHHGVGDAPERPRLDALPAQHHGLLQAQAASQHGEDGRLVLDALDSR